MKHGKRSDRVAEEIRKILGPLVLNRLKDPRIGFVTITRVWVSDDLRHAKVYYSVLGSASEQKATAAALGRALPYLQREIKVTLPIKIIPTISLKYDPSVVESIELDGLITRIHEEDGSERTNSGDST